jgi:hypothetical protein
MSEQSEQDLLLISPAISSPVKEAAPVDREGGEEHGAISRAISAIVGAPTHINKIDPDVFGERLSTSIARATKAVQSNVASALGEFTVDEVKVSLAISAEGDIGIATAGMKASIEVTLKHAKMP